MPIAPKYTWQETETSVQVHVQISGVSRKRLDVFSTSALIKVNAPPYLFAVDLVHDVDDDKSTATVDSKGVLFSLVKKVPGTWGQLEAEGSLDEIARRREVSIDEAHAKANAARQAKLDKKKADETKLRDRQWDLEKAKRRLVEQRKQEEFDAEATDLKRWQASLHDPAANDSGTESDEDEAHEVASKSLAEDIPMPDHPDYHGRGFRAADSEEGGDAESAAASYKGPEKSHPVLLEAKEPRPEADGDIWKTDAIGEEDKDSSEGNDTESDDDNEAFMRAPQTIKPLPPPRRRLEPVEVSFTKLETDVLPAREKREVELKQYKKEQMAKTGLLDTLDIAERQPVFLKDKGDALYAQGNYMGAINAYSTAIQLDSEHFLSFANRAAAWLKAGSAQDCLDDCDRAIELLRPRLRRYETGDAEPGELEKFRRTMTRVLSRRGAALCQMDKLADAMEAYKEAVKFSPNDEALKLNLEEVRAAMEPADCTTLRKRADARFKAGDAAGAAEAYNLLLTMPDLPPAERTAIISNRAAAHLKSGEFQAAVKDCNEGIVGLLEGCGVAGLGEKLYTWISEYLLASPTPYSRDSAKQSSNANKSDLSKSSFPAGWAPGDAKRSSLQRMLARRGAAFSHLRLYQEAISDLSSASSICWSNGDEGPALSLEADAEKIRQLMEQEKVGNGVSNSSVEITGQMKQEDSMDGLD